MEYWSYFTVFMPSDTTATILSHELVQLLFKGSDHSRT